MAKEFKLLIDGAWKEFAQKVEVRNPYNGNVIGTTSLADANGLEEAVLSSQKAFNVTKSLPAFKRAEIIQRVIEGLNTGKDEIASIITAESGKPILDSRSEVSRAINTFTIACEETKRICGEILPLDIVQGSEGKVGMVRRFPIGPVLGITPFNFPLNLVAHKVAPAMASGNTIIIKPSPRTPLTALTLGKIVLDAGWPSGGMNVVLCSNDDVERFVRDERISMLSFTGSAEIGWKLKGIAGRKRINLELGGNAGVIVHCDTDIELAAKRCALGAFSFAGQVCISVQRVYVQKNIYEPFLDRFQKAVESLKIGNPMDDSVNIGPMIDEQSAERAELWVNEAVAGGANILAGGRRKGKYLEPTVLTDTNPQMAVSCEEVFAPIVSLESYDSFEEAVTSLNNSRYGLQAGVFTRDIERINYAFHELNVGGVIINDIPTYRVDHMPYGGIKMSGFGREGIKYAMEEMSELKLLAIKLG